jgi:hypothetical protein
MSKSSLYQQQSKYEYKNNIPQWMGQQSEGKPARAKAEKWQWLNTRITRVEDSNKNLSLDLNLHRTKPHSVAAFVPYSSFCVRVE